MLYTYARNRPACHGFFHVFQKVDKVFWCVTLALLPNILLAFRYLTDFFYFRYTLKYSTSSSVLKMLRARLLDTRSSTVPVLMILLLTTTSLTPWRCTLFTACE